MDLNNRGEVVCVGVRKHGKEKVLAVGTRQRDGRVLMRPCDGTEALGPRWDWTDLLPDLCKRVCGKCPSREAVHHE